MCIVVRCVRSRCVRGVSLGVRGRWIRYRSSLLDVAPSLLVAECSVAPFLVSSSIVGLLRPSRGAVGGHHAGVLDGEGP